MIMPATAKFMMLTLLGGFWLLAVKHVMRLDNRQPFHLAIDQRDRRKARFYFLSVWIGLVTALICFMGLEVVDGSFFSDPSQRQWVLNIMRGAGMFGLGVVALIWGQVGQRVSLSNSDGKSPVPLPEEEKNQFKK